MSAPGATPGPWSVPHFSEPEVNCNCGYVLSDHMMGAVCTVHASGDGDDWIGHGDNPKFAEACANARLIAAAPDLYRAAEMLAGLYHGKNEGRSFPTQEQCDFALAALAKARGQ